MSCECTKALNCGECCKSLSFFLIDITEEQRYYYETHGCKVRGDEVIVPNICPHLKENVCDIWETEEYPNICRNFKGQSEGYFVPDMCVYTNDYKNEFEAIKEIKSRKDNINN